MIGVAGIYHFAAGIGKLIEAANLNRTIDGEYPEFSEFTGRLSVKPIQAFALSANAAYNYYIEAFTRLNATVKYENPESPVSGSFSYNIYRNAYANPEYFINRSTIRGQLLLDFARFPFKLDSGVEYDVTEKELRFVSAKIFLDYQCLTINVEYVYRFWYGYAEPDHMWNFGISFGNLGAVADFFSPGGSGENK